MGKLDRDKNCVGGQVNCEHGAGKVTAFGLVGALKCLCKKIFPLLSQPRNTHIENKVITDRIVYSDYWCGYNALHIPRFTYYRIDYSAVFVDKYNHISGIDKFLEKTKRY